MMLGMLYIKGLYNGCAGEGILDLTYSHLWTIYNNSLFNCIFVKINIKENYPPYFSETAYNLS